MKIGIYGGSFNPIHYGHTGMAAWVAKHTDVDEVWLMVTPNNPLKPSGILAPEDSRLEAARKTIAALQEEERKAGGVSGIDKVRVSDFEFGLPKPTYTAQTLRCLTATYPNDTFCLLIGEDNWAIRERWCEWDYIEGHFEIYVYPRKTAKESEHCMPKAPIASVHILEGAPLFDISSTEIRGERGMFRV